MGGEGLKQDQERRGKFFNIKFRIYCNKSYNTKITCTIIKMYMMCNSKIFSTKKI